MRYLFLLLILFFYGEMRSQTGKLNEGNAILFGIGYGLQSPGGDLKDRFGSNFYLSSQVEYLTQKNWGIGIDGGFLFGSEVKEDVLRNLRNQDGSIIGNDRSIADIQLRQRGFYFGMGLNKLLGLGTKNDRAGIKLGLNAGFIQHKIRIQDDPVRTVPTLDEQGKKGYDRLSNGWYLSQFIGYQQLGVQRKINFYVGLESFQGFTQNRRDFNFDTRIRDDQNRLDLMWGIKVGWILPFYSGYGEEIFY